MKSLLTIILFFFSLNTIGQIRKNYPIETVLGDDSVVIITTSQARKTNQILDKQSKEIKTIKKRIQELETELSQTQNELTKNKSDVSKLTEKIQKDSIKFKDLVKSNLTKTKQLDTLTKKLNLIEDWLFETSVGNAYMFFDWSDSLVKVMDLTLYGGEINDITGNLTLNRRGDNKEYSEFRKQGWQFPESPTKEWAKVNNKELKPLIYPFLYKFKLKNPFLGSFYKNPYMK